MLNPTTITNAEFDALLSEFDALNFAWVMRKLSPAETERRAELERFFESL